jgi:uncharacterized protein YajQ (UPF0234 family)
MGLTSLNAKNVAGGDYSKREQHLKQGIEDRKRKGIVKLFLVTM